MCIEFVFAEKMALIEISKKFKISPFSELFMVNPNKKKHTILKSTW